MKNYVLGYSDFMCSNMISQLNTTEKKLHYLHLEIYGSNTITHFDFNLQNLKLQNLQSFKCIMENTEISIFDIEIFCKNLRNIWVDCLNFVGELENIMEFLKSLARPKLRHLILQTLWDKNVILEISSKLKEMFFDREHKINWVILKDDCEESYILLKPNFIPQIINAKQIDSCWNFVT